MKKNKLLPIACCAITWIVAIIYLIINAEVSSRAIAIIFLMSIQLIAAISDINSMTIPMKLMIPCFGIALLMNFVSYKTSETIYYIAGAGIAFAVLKLLIFVSKGQVGNGDLVLMTVTGLFEGISGFFSILFLSVILAGMYSLILIVIDKANKGTELPFAPFVLIATAVLTFL